MAVNSWISYGLISYAHRKLLSRKVSVREKARWARVVLNEISELNKLQEGKGVLLHLSVFVYGFA